MIVEPRLWACDTAAAQIELHLYRSLRSHAVFSIEGNKAMGNDFDPYHAWLGIPKREQPPGLREHAEFKALIPRRSAGISSHERIDCTRYVGQQCCLDAAIADLFKSLGFRGLASDH